MRPLHVPTEQPSMLIDMSTATQLDPACADCLRWHLHLTMLDPPCAGMRRGGRGQCRGRVSLLGTQAKESWELDTKEKLAAAAAKKDAGNDKFKAGKTALAIKKYKVRHHNWQPVQSGRRLACRGMCRPQNAEYRCEPGLCARSRALRSATVKAGPLETARLWAASSLGTQLWPAPLADYGGARHACICWHTCFVAYQ